MIDPVAVRIGSFSIHWYGVIIAAAVLTGLYLVIREGKRKGIEPEFFLDYIIVTIPVAVIAARIYYVVFRYGVSGISFYRLIAVWRGGLAIHGAIIGGFITLWIFCRRENITLCRVLDIMTPAVVLGQAIGRWGNFINREAYGGIVSEEFIKKFPDFIRHQMYIGGNYHHPAFLYESMLDLFIFILLLGFRRKNFIKCGDIFLIYAGTYSLGRYFIEGIRMDSLMIGPYRVAQIISIVIFVISILVLVRRHYQ